jgi:hypothetical protein
MLAGAVLACDGGASDSPMPADSAPVPAVGIWPNAHERTSPSGSACEYFLNLDEQAARFRARVVESNVTALTIPVTWRSVDPGTGAGPDFSESGLLHAAIAEGYDVFVNLAPIWSYRYTTPSDLGDELPSDAGAAAREFPWRGFERYVHEVGAQVHEHLPRAKVTVTFTTVFLSSEPTRSNILALRDDTDVLAVNFYDYVDSASHLTSAFETIFQDYPADWPIAFQELGFLAPPDTEPLQVAFIEEAFDFGARESSRIPYMGFFSLHDWHLEPEPCEPIGAADPCDPCEPDCRWCGSANGPADWVSTVGLLRDDGSAKPAWEPFKALAAEFRTLRASTGASPRLSDAGGI